MIIIKFNDGHENFMMIMRTAPWIMIFKGTKDSLNDGHEKLMMIMRTASSQDDHPQGSSHDHHSVSLLSH